MSQKRHNFQESNSDKKNAEAFRAARFRSGMLGVVTDSGTGLVPEILERLAKKLSGHKATIRPAD